MAATAAVAAAVAALYLFKEAATAAIRAVGGFANALADANDAPGKTLQQSGEAISSFSDKLFFLGPVMGTLGKVVGETAAALGAFMQALDGLVNRYENFSPHLAQAQAQAEMTHFMGEIRRAQEAGPALARYVQSRTEMQQKFEDIKIKLLLKIMPIAEALMAVVNKILKSVEGGINLATALVEAIPFLSEAVGKIFEIMRRQEDEERAQWSTPTEDIMRAGRAGRYNPMFNAGPLGGSSAPSRAD